MRDTTRYVLLKKGDKIRLKVRTLFGWKGIGIVMEDQIERGGDASIRYQKEGTEQDMCFALRYQVSKCRAK